MGKFDDVPVEEDTKVRWSREKRLEDFDVLHQKWVWDGMVGESAIFVSDEVKHLSDSDLQSLVSQASWVTGDGGVTITRSPKGYTFANFNFLD